MLIIYIFLAFLPLFNTSSFAQPAPSSTATMATPSNTDYAAAPVVKNDASTKQKEEKKPSGEVIVEKYTDTDGTIKYKKYRYGFQYDEKKIINDKPKGEVQYKSSKNPDGSETKEGYVWGFQYANKDASTNSSTSSKPKSPKFQTIKRAPITVTGSTAQGAAAPGTPPDQTKGANAGKLDTKPENIQKTIEEMIKKSQQPIK
ncbi:MAG: hypothetical protein WCQ47_03865 [bacterium]